MQMIFHDSRLFSDIEPRQRSTIFKIAFEEAKNSNIQYIASVNEDQITPLKELLGKENYKKIIEDNIVLELTDESDKTKLLGIQVDMRYEKDIEDAMNS